MPALLVMIMLVFQVGLFWHAKQAADVAAEEAVDAAQLAAATETDGLAGANAILAHTGNLHDAVVQVDRDEATGRVTVTITGRAVRVVPFGSWQVTAHAQGSIETFISAVQR
jgi:Flp pilus assembly protein TadG